MKRKLICRTLTVLLPFLLVICLLPATALAADTATVQINGKTLQNGVSVPCGEGTAVLDEESGTLTLNNATINQEGTTPVLRANNGELKVILIGENTITSTSMKPFYCSGVDLTIQGTEKDSLTIKTESDGLQIDNGNLTIDGCKIDITSSSYGGMLCFGNYSTGEFGILTIQNGANISIDSFENTLLGEYELSITGSTVNATARSNYQDWSTTAVSSYGNISITDSAVTATANGDEANAIYGGGTISINNSEVEATTTVQSNVYPALCAAGNIEIINHSAATVKSAGTIGIWSSGGEVVIQDSIAYAAAHDEWEAIRGDNGGVTISDSWVETFGSMVSPLFAHSDSVIFLNNEGEANGSLVLPGNITVSEDMQLSVPENSSVTVPEGVTFTNHGQIELHGDLINNGGNIVCNSHSGGTATCTVKALCGVCGAEYGDFLPHELTETEAKEATCSEEGYTGDKACAVCGETLEKGEVIPKLAHDYRDGKCTVCGAADPDYSESPQTGDYGNILPWIALLFAAGGFLGTMYFRKRAFRG